MIVSFIMKDFNEDTIFLIALAIKILYFYLILQEKLKKIILFFGFTMISKIFEYFNKNLTQFLSNHYILFLNIQ